MILIRLPNYWLVKMIFRLLKPLKDKTIDDFNVLKSQLKTQIKHTENDIVEMAKGVLTLIEECGLEFNDFSRSYFPNILKN